MEFKVYARKDLNMRRGKLAAQCAHAAMKLVLDMMTVVDGNYLMKKRNYSLYEQWVKYGMQINVSFVEDMEAINDLISKASLHDQRRALIIDSGRTEFKGVSTPTCLGFLPENWEMEESGFEEYIKLQKRFVDNNIPEAKQVIVVNRKIKLTKEEFASNVAQASVRALMKNAELYGDGLIIRLEDGSPLLSWLAGSYTKIVLGVDKPMNAFCEMRDSKLIYTVNLGDLFCFASNAEFPEVINAVTGNYKLM